MATYIEMKQQAERLMSEAEAMRKHELAAVINQIKGEISAYGLTPKDLGFSMPATIKGRFAAPSNFKASAISSDAGRQRSDGKRANRSTADGSPSP